MTETVTITKEEHNFFVFCARLLKALEVAGIDAWEKFEAVLKEVEESLKKDTQPSV